MSSSAPTIDKLDKNFVPAEVADGQNWYDIRTLGVEGKGWAEKDTQTPFDRLPARAKGVVRDPVWVLSECSAGLCVRFVTNATSISAKWNLRSGNFAMPHMPATGVSGLDLYGKVKGKWVWAGVGVPNMTKENKAQLAGGLAGEREYLLYLPLYNGVTNVSIGLPAEATLKPAPARRGKRAKGVVVYGTSIVQGGCACRTGMGYPEIMARSLDCAMINLGFSGNGPMDLEMGPFLAELDPAVYVLDCLPNMGPATVTERAFKFVTALREARPKTPIVLVENIEYQRFPVQAKGSAGHEKKNELLRVEWKKLQKARVPGLHYVGCKNLLGKDNLGTVDGTHPTDIGFVAQAAEIGKTVAKLLK